MKWMPGKGATLKRSIAALYADYDSYANKTANDQEDSRQELKGEQLQIASIKESSTNRQVENHS